MRGIWFLVICLIVGWGFWAAQARAEGYIAGTVRDGDGNPLAGIYVEAYEVNFGYVSTGCVPPRPLENKLTNAEGQYGFCVWNGIYKVFFRGVSPHVSRWYNSTSYSGATSLVVREGQGFPYVDATLSTSGGALLEGRVTGPGDVGLPGVQVEVYSAGQTVEARHGLAYAVSDGTGAYAISAPLPPGSYKIKCNDQTSQNNHLPEWWNDKSDISLADALLITSEGPNRADCKLSNGGILSGRVINSVLLPVANAVINVYDSARKLSSYISTNTEGYYTARRLGTGDYKVLFKGPFGSSLAYEWYNNQPSFDQANRVPVVAGATTDNINARLFTGGAISGFITDGTAGISGLVRIYDAYGDLVATGFSEATGNYLVDGLPAGMYRVELSRYDKSSLWYKFSRTSADAVWVTVTSGGVTSGINGVLSPAAVISGTVTDPQGRGIPRVTVRTYDDATQEPLSCQDGTDSLGEYTVRSLSPGATRVFFDSRGTGYFPEWWDDKKSAAAAVAIQLAAGVTYPDRDAQLGPSREVYFPLLLHNP
jgi:hypothetical protein